MIWGVPRSKGGIVIRKPFRLFFCILFAINIITACSTTTPAQFVAINTPSPSQTQFVATDTSSPSPASPTSTPSVRKITPTPLPGYIASPDWLPAGIIAFSILTAQRTEEIIGSSALYLVNSDGTGLVQLADGPDTWNDYPNWSPDGTRIVYGVGPYDLRIYSLWVINVDGSHPVQLTKLPPSDLSPAWSPDGTKIAFLTNSTKGLDTNVSIMNADGSNQKVLTSSNWDRFPAWTPNGKILFLRYYDEYYISGDVFTINPDGTGLAQLTKVGYVGGYALSPDGTKLAIHNTKDRRIEVIPLESGGPGIILVNSDFGFTSVALSWSPDGQALAMDRSSWYDYTVFKWDTVMSFPIYIFKADGSSYTTVPNTEGALDIAWRPSVP